MMALPISSPSSMRGHLHDAHAYNTGGGFHGRWQAVGTGYPSLEQQNAQAQLLMPPMHHGSDRAASMYASNSAVGMGMVSSSLVFQMTGYVLTFVMLP